MIFILSYYSALDNAIRRRGVDLSPQKSEQCAPSGWTCDEVSAAFLKHNPGSSIVCITQLTTGR